MKSIGIGEIIQNNNQNYRIEEELGDGGYATVYRAVGDDGINYAVKVIKGYSDAYLKSFYNEYDKACKVDSAHVIHYFYMNQHGNNDRPCFIIMEYADGGSLKELIEKHRKAKIYFSTAELKAIYLQLIDGMIDVSNSLVHRDLKTENILIDTQGYDSNAHIEDVVFKISDYGIAKNEGEDTRTETFKGIGSKLYYAPELWLNPGAHGLNTVKIDMYAMGIVFYELANLYYPYKYDKITDPKDMHVNGIVKPFNSSIDPVFKNMISTMLEKSPKDRYENWETIRDYLANSSVGLGVKRSGIAEDILNSSLAKEEAEKKKAIEEEKKKTEKKDAFKLLLNKVNSKIYCKLRDTVEEVERDKKNTVLLTEPKTDFEEETYSFEYYIGNRVISFEFESLHDEMPKKAYSFNTHIDGRSIDPFSQQLIGGVPNQPFVYKYYQDKILLWGRITADCNAGINVALLEDKSDPFGELVMYEYIPNYNNYIYSFPVTREKLKRIIRENCDPGHTFKKIPFDFQKIRFLIRLFDIYEPDSLRDPIAGMKRLR